MKLGWPIEIAGTGAYLPAQVVDNAAMSVMVNTTDEWIIQRTGIRERRKIGEGESTLQMATAASRDALADAGLAPEDVDLIVVATATSEYQLPSTACLLQAELGCRWITAFDYSAACSGYVWAFTCAAQYIRTGMARNALVVGAESLTTITDMQDRGTCILFGDAAGAAVLRPAGDSGCEILAASSGADGGRGRLIMIPGGGSRHPASHETVDKRMHYMKMQGREVYKFAVMQMQSIIHETCKEAGITADELKLVIPHQSNLRIIESACKRAGVPMDRVSINIDRYGNTSAASVAVALHEERKAGRFGAGDLVLMVAFGAGLTWGSALLRT